MKIKELRYKTLTPFFYQELSELFSNNNLKMLNYKTSSF